MQNFIGTKHKNVIVVNTVM